MYIHGCDTASLSKISSLRGQTGGNEEGITTILITEVEIASDIQSREMRGITLHLDQIINLDLLGWLLTAALLVINTAILRASSASVAHIIILGD
jgi:hypothetical protein